ncbi:MAG: hypothetical protein ABL882_03955 [Sphingopyxis sp.]
MHKEFSLLSLDWLHWSLIVACVILAGLCIAIFIKGASMNDDNDFHADR